MKITTAKFNEGTQVIGIGRNNRGLVATVTGTNVWCAGENEVHVKYMNGVMCFETGKESTWGLFNENIH